MKSANKNWFQTLIFIYCVIFMIFIGKVFFDNIRPIQNTSRSDIPILSTSKLQQVSTLLNGRIVLTATQSASVSATSFGKDEPFSQ